MNHDEAASHAFDGSHEFCGRRAARQYGPSADANPPGSESGGHVVGEHEDTGRRPARHHMAKPIAVLAAEIEEDHVGLDVVELLAWRQPDPPSDEDLEALVRVEPCRKGR